MPERVYPPRYLAQPHANTFWQLAFPVQDMQEAVCSRRKAEEAHEASLAEMAL